MSGSPALAPRSSSAPSSEFVTETLANSVAAGRVTNGQDCADGTIDDRYTRLDSGPVLLGTRIGRYVVGARLGAGGMGEVFEAHDVELDRPVALKLIKCHRDPELALRERLRLRAEAQSLARLSHPNVVQVYEVGEHEGRTFLAMELVHGPTLGEFESESLAEILAVFAAAGRGLAAAHAAGLAHRDFKPSNALIGADGRVRVVDFGLAVHSAAAAERASTIGDETDDVTGDRSGSAREHGRPASVGGPGTLPYMAPEQAFDGAGGPAGDQFSFCVALFEAVYGVRPFPARGVMELLCKLDTCVVEIPASAPVVPRWLQRLLLRGLSRRPEDRFPSMDALVDELARDRGRLWRRLGFAALIAGVTAATVLAFTPPRPTSSDDAVAAPSLAGTWDRDRRVALSLSFEREQSTWLEGSQATTLAGLDLWSERWLDQARLSAALDEGARASVVVCLERQRAQLDATVDALIDGDARLLEGAVAAVDALPDPGRCQLEGADAIEAEVDMPIARSLAEAEVNRQLGHFELAWAGADEVLRQAGQRGWDRLHLAALRQRGLADLGAGRREAGLADLERARDRAIAQADPRMVAELSVDLAWAGRGLDNPQLRRDRLALARAHVRALSRVSAGSPEVDRHAQRLGVRVGLAEALDALARGRAEDGDKAAHSERAEVLLLDGLELLAGLDEADSLLAIDHLHALAVARDQAGRLDEAEQGYRRAIELAERVRGQGHPDNAKIWHDAGALAVDRGEVERARERLVRARDLRRAALRVDHPELARSELALGSIAFVEGDWATSRRHADAALASLERSTGDRDALPETLRLLGQLEARQENWTAAVANYERALALMPADADVQRALLELELGKSLAVLGEHARAFELMDAALPVVADRIGAARCGQLVRSYERHAQSAAALGHDAAARASLETALSCERDPDTRARLEAALR